LVHNDVAQSLIPFEILEVPFESKLNQEFGSPLGNGTFFSTKFVWMPSIYHRRFTINEELW
jgi:hypothetical protein